MKLSKKQTIIISSVIFIIALIIVVWQFKFADHFPSKINLEAPANFWGITFSKRYTSSLQMSWRETYLAILDDLQVKRVRLPMYWTDIEATADNYDFTDYDWLMDQSLRRGVKIVPVLGRRQPRWPECHIPKWAKDLDETKQQEKILSLIEKTINRYKYYDNIESWQVENEALLNTFGECPPANPEFLVKEINLVRSLDNRPIIITGSGELSSWKKEGQLGDFFGTTVYRVVWNKYVGYLRYGLPPSYYQFKAKNAKLPLTKTIIAELQTEPWAPGDIKALSRKNINKSFSPDQFKANLQFAINTEFTQTYLWGVEWWYYQKLNGHPEYWNIAKGLKW